MYPVKWYSCITFSRKEETIVNTLSFFCILTLDHPLSLTNRKSMSQHPTAGVHTFCERRKPIPDGAGQYYVAGETLGCSFR